MSQIKLKSNPAGTGEFIIESPNSNSSRTLTLPDEAGEVLTDTQIGTSVLAPNGDGSQLTNLPAGGKVLQVVQGTTTTETTTSSTSFVATALSVNITPSAASSKILVMVNSCGNFTGTTHKRATIYRDATNLGGGAESCLIESGYNNPGTVKGLHMKYLDSPNTTAAITYKMYGKTNGSTGRFNSGNVLHTIIAIEIGA